MPSGLIVKQDSLSGFGEGTVSPGVASRLGLQAVVDFYTYMALQGAAFQVRAGTITAPLVGDVVITDTAAEYCVDAASGTTIIPVYNNISIRLGAGTLHEYAIKSVGALATVGAAFVPLPLRPGNKNGAGGVVAATSTARVAAAGGVTVAAELATTTRRHWSFSNPVAVGAGNSPDALEWSPRVPPVLVGPYCLYVQVAATGTGPSYFANLDYIEVPTATLL
jgi:hypothetical protein